MAVPHGIVEIRARYGNPAGKKGKVNPDWVRSHMVRMAVPWPAIPTRPAGGMRNAYDPSKIVTKVWLHGEVADSWRECMMEVWAYARRAVKLNVGYGLTTPEYDRLTYEYLVSAGLDLWGGSWVYRFKRLGGKQLSTHAFGIAFDDDPAKNKQGTAGRMPQWFVRIWLDGGWVWGGDWKGKSRDPMHFQKCSGY